MMKKNENLPLRISGQREQRLDEHTEKKKDAKRRERERERERERRNIENQIYIFIIS